MEILMSPRIRTALASCLLLLVFAPLSARSVEISNVFLPGHVETNDGQVSLYADYGSIETDGRVPVYLVNKSSEDLVLNAQDGDIYLKLEYEDSSGDWVRAQPHGYSWCGNSYYERTLPPGHYTIVSGYQPINGVPRSIRYNLYSQDIKISSNVGNGVVAEVDIRRAASDVMSINEGAFEYVVQVALSDVPVDNKMDYMRDLRGVAIRALTSDRFDSGESREVLMKIREKNPGMVDEVDRAIRTLDQRLAESGI
jgi:hypothetical protein